MAFHWRRRESPKKSANFTRRPPILPKQLVKIEKFVPICSFCPMRSLHRCEIPTCNAPLCGRHVIRKSGGNLCPRHKMALLVQHDGLPTTRFGDRGDAVPHVEEI
jgi:hypothetical protein